MARNAPMIPSQQTTANAQDIGYVLGKMEMIEKKLDEHQVETRQEQEEIMDKLDKLSESFSFWRHSFWLLKAILVSIPLILASNYEDLVAYWKGL